MHAHKHAALSLSLPCTPVFRLMAAGGTSHPQPTEGVYTLFVRSDSEATCLGFDLPGIMMRHQQQQAPGYMADEAPGDCKQQLVLALCKALQLPRPAEYANMEEDDDEEVDPRDADWTDDPALTCVLSDASGRVALNVTGTGLEDFYEDGSYFIVTVMPGAFVCVCVCCVGCVRLFLHGSGYFGQARLCQHAASVVLQTAHSW